MNNFELDTKSDKGSPAASGATAAGTPAESSSPRQISLPAEFLALCDEAHEDYDPRFSLTWGCLWDWLLFEFGIVSFALYVRPSAASKERSVKVAAAPATTRPSRPSTVLKQNSGVNVASCLLAAPATAAAPAAAAPAPAPAEGSERRSSQMRRRSTISASIQGLHPARRRERQREKRRASAVLAGGSWSGYVVTNPPREQPLNEDDCVYVFMSLRQLRDASAPNGRLSLLDNLRPRAPPAARRRRRAGGGADHAAVAAATTLRRVTQLERLLEHLSGERRAAAARRHRRRRRRRRRVVGRVAGLAAQRERDASRGSRRRAPPQRAARDLPRARAREERRGTRNPDDAG